MPRRLPPDRQGDPVRAAIDLVAPLGFWPTATRTHDIAGDLTRRDGSSAVASLIGVGLRQGDVDSANLHSTPPTATTPGIRTSTTATRTTGTRTSSSELVASANQSSADPADFSFEDMVVAYLDCRQHKRNTPSALAFESDRERNLVGLYEELVDGSYRLGTSTCFVVLPPKPREVWAAEFRDRIVQHLLYNHISPRFYASFIADSCACIPGRGTLYAAQRLESKVRSITQNWSRPAYYLKCDIANFFVSVDKHILRGLLAARIHEPWWLWLSDLILFHDPRPDARVQSTPGRMALIPAHKSLFNQAADKGLPIGNIDSQFDANVYLDVMDQFAKHRLRARHYIRYVDDFILLHESPQWLNDARGQIESLLAERLNLQLNPRKTILQPIDRGIDFVGHVIKPWRRTVRRRTLNHALSRIDRVRADELYETANSYFGYFRQASHSHSDRVALARRVLRRGHSVDYGLTKAFRKGAA